MSGQRNQTLYFLCLCHRRFGGPGHPHQTNRFIFPLSLLVCFTMGEKRRGEGEIFTFLYPVFGYVPGVRDSMMSRR